MKQIMLSYFFIFNSCIAPQTANYSVVLTSETKNITLDSIQKYQVNYTITNYSSTELLVDKNDFPVEEGEGSKIFFKISTFENLRSKEYHIENDGAPVMMGEVIGLKKGESFTYHFEIFGFYNINKPGKYYIQGYYKDLFGKKNYPTAQASNVLELIVK